MKEAIAILERKLEETQKALAKANKETEFAAESLRRATQLEIIYEESVAELQEAIVILKGE